MKKIATMLCMMMMVCTATQAQVYDETNNVITPDTTFSHGSVGYWGFDGIDNVGFAASAYNKFGKNKSFGMDMNIRWGFKTYTNYNYDIGINYILLGGRNTKAGKTTTGFYIVTAAGPSLRLQDVPEVKINEKTGKVSTKKTTDLFIDAFVNLRLLFIYKKFDVSLGSYLWIPEWKFNNDYMQLGWNVSIGYDF